jgi:uncharacterized membrane protein
MSNLIAVAYPDVETAHKVADVLHELSRDKSIVVDDMVVVEREADGKIRLHQTGKSAGHGAAHGAMWGGIIGLVFFVPLLGAAIGAATGAATNAFTDQGESDKFMEKLGERLANGGGAVVVLVRRSRPDEVIPRIANYGGEVIESSLDHQTEAELDDALGARA